MADISDIQAAQSVKIVGSDSAGVEQTPVQSTANGAVHFNARDNAGAEVPLATSTLQATLDTSVNSLLKPASTLNAVTTVGSITNTVTIKADTQANQANALKVDGSGVLQPVTGTDTAGIFFVNRVLTVQGSGVGGVPLSISGTVTGPLTDIELRAAPVIVTANAGTNLNTSALALETTQVAGNTTLTGISNKISDQTYPISSVLTVADTTTVSTVGQNGQIVYSGSASVGSVANFLYSNLTVVPNTLTLRISGTWVGTAQVEGSNDNGVTWVRLNIVLDSNLVITSFTGNLIGTVTVVGYDRIRVRATAVTSGNISVNGRFSVGVGNVNIINTVSAAQSGVWAIRNQDGLGNPIASIDDGNGTRALAVAQSATNFVFSSLNSTTAQLAVGATYTGTIEVVTNQQSASILLTSDQNGTLIFREYIDAAGLRPSRVSTYTILANVPFSRSFALNGNYFRASFQNTGTATTTTLNLNTAYGTIPSATVLGNEPVSLDEVSGIAMGARPDGFLRTQIDPTTLLLDNFETLDTVNTWTIGGTVLPTGSAGNLSVAPGTAANASSYAKSIPTFTQGSNAFLQMANIIQLEAGVVTGNKRFWGLGNFTTPTLTVPLTNGAIFEIDQTTGSLFTSVYSNSVRTQTTTIVRPTDGGFHRYAIYYKSSRVYFELDNIQVATFAFPNVQVASLSTVIGSVNGAATVASAPVLNAALIGLADSGRNATKLADGTFPWRTQQITAAGAQVNTSVDGFKSTYSCSVLTLAPTTLATDIFTITGSATKTIRINRITLSGTQTTASVANIILTKRSTANTAGTSAAQTAVPHNSTNPAATATVLAYTANPTLGTFVGNLVTKKLFISTTTGTPDEFKVEFGTRNSQAIVLNGTSQVIAINLGGVTLAGASLNITIEWTEES